MFLDGARVGDMKARKIGGSGRKWWSFVHFATFNIPAPLASFTVIHGIPDWLPLSLREYDAQLLHLMWYAFDSCSSSFDWLTLSFMKTCDPNSEPEIYMYFYEV